MKKILVLIVLALIASMLPASPCFEELETLTLSVVAATASKPQLSLPGVVRYGEGLVPEKIKFSSSDVSTYYSALTTRPKGLSLVESALFATTQHTSVMKQIQEMLLSSGYGKGDLVVDGKIVVDARKDLDAVKISLSNDLSSVSMSVTVDLVLTERGKVWKTEGTLEVSGDSRGTLVVESKEFRVNDLKYQVDLKYRFAKSS